MKDQLTLLHFDTTDDLLAGVETLQQHHIAIREIYSAMPIPEVEGRLRIKRLQYGEKIFRYGCLGSVGLVSLALCFLESRANWQTVLLNAMILLITLVIANSLFAVKAPSVFMLKKDDKRLMVVVDTRSIQVDEAVNHLFQYTGAVELSPSIKNIVIS